MKKFIALLIIVVTLLTLCSCDMDAPTRVEKEPDAKGGSMFVVVEKADYLCVVYHKETKVMYAVSMAMENCGTFTVLVDPEGKPLLWEKTKE